MRRIAIAAAIVSLACATSSRTVPINEPFLLPFGEAVTVESGPALRFVSVGEDSRCPTNVQCVWAGNAAVVLEIEHGGETARVRLNTMGGDRFPSTAQAFGYTIELLDVRPYPGETRADQEKYSAQLRVSLNR